MAIQGPSFSAVNPNFNRAKEAQEEGDKLAEFFNKGMSAKAAAQNEAAQQQVRGEQAMAQQVAKAQQEQALRESDLAAARQLRTEVGSEIPVHVGSASIGGKDPLSSYLQGQRIKDLDEERLNRAVERGAKTMLDSGLPAMEASMKRVEGISPGLIAGKAEPKSVGGIKNLAPNWAVSPLEKLGIMPEGAGAERAAMQDLLNTKIYDSSGKQINEAEMKRIVSAFGMQGIFDADTIKQAIQQMGATTLEKARTAEAGIRPEAKKLLQERGAVNVGNIEKMVTGGGSGASGLTPEQRRARIQELKQKLGK